ncbi:dienelactone hydrolase family protein [Aquisalimonas sp.]|uniref:alpha/beta hydrolase n=1 Tax=Aquisalimonas sp. TaxID=1872621 RepID=UPI0025C71662|nr:dienelactone hydrolase family protein [Aquisalimonas sp.]
MSEAKLDCMEVYTRREVASAAVMLHGLGASANDLSLIVKHLQRARELGLHYLAPNAPIRAITVNKGRVTRAWYDVFGDPNEVPQDREGVLASAKQLSALLDHERQKGIPTQRTILGGFSQGATMALHVGLRYPYRLAGIVALSGELVLPEDLERGRHPANAQTPILMVHGTADPVVPIEAAEDSRDRLRSMGYAVHWHTLPVDHAVSLEEVEIVDRWMYAVLTGNSLRADQ